MVELPGRSHEESDEIDSALRQRLDALGFDARLAMAAALITPVSKNKAKETFVFSYPEAADSWNSAAEWVSPADRALTKEARAYRLTRLVQYLRSARAPSDPPVGSQQIERTAAAPQIQCGSAPPVQSAIEFQLRDATAPLPESEPEPRESGTLTEVLGLIARAKLPSARIGELVTIARRSHRSEKNSPISAEVVGFQSGEALLAPLDDLADVEPGAKVTPTSRAARVGVGVALLGRTIDALGQPIDGGPPILASEQWAIDRKAPRALERGRARDVPGHAGQVPGRALWRPLWTQIGAIDLFATLGEGQRVGLFSPAGVGKSTLLTQLATQVRADVCVIALIGERGREAREFAEHMQAEARISGAAKYVIVCETADAPARRRVLAAQTATSVAEWFRDCAGLRVLLLVDSVTRIARAQREIGLASGEPPTRQGFPPSTFALLPKLFERAGQAARGSITAVYAVLTSDDTLADPVAEEVRGLLDGHIVLSQALAQRGHYPAIDPLKSISRLASRLASARHLELAARVRKLVAIFEERRDLIALGGYQKGSDPATDEALSIVPRLEALLRQPADQSYELEHTLTAIERVFAEDIS